MFKKIASLALVAAAASTGMLMDMTPAEAGNTCKRVYMRVDNGTSKRIKVIDIDYYNPASGRYKSEPTRNREVPAGQTRSDTRNLEQVNARRTWIKVKYRIKKPNGRWSKVRSKTSTAGTCRRGSTYKVVLH